MTAEPGPVGARPLPPVVVLAPDLARNAVGRALVFADLLQGQRDVTVAGTASGGWWPPLAERVDLRVAQLPAHPRRAVSQLRELARGAVVIASKPLLRSYGLALAAGVRPVVLDIDDPELALATADVRTAIRASATSDNPLLTASLLALRPHADATTAASAALADGRSAVVVPHARDEALFTEERRDRRRARDELGIPARVPLVAYVGTVRGHKGIDELRRAVRRVAISGVRLAIVGAQNAAPDEREAWVPPLPYRGAMRWVAAADVVVVPQLPTRIGRAQSPAKVVDALAMGRALVASDLPPIADLAGNAAALVAAGSVEALAGAIQRLLEDRSERERLEAAARERFLAALGVRAVRPRLLRLLDAVGGPAR